MPTAQLAVSRPFVLLRSVHSHAHAPLPAAFPRSAA
jgi:hypothetical protein